MGFKHFLSLSGIPFLSYSFNYLPITFNFSLEILVIQEIREIQQILQLKFSLRMSWLDSRLDFYNIKVDKSMNVISLEELNKIWLPVVVFDNTAKSQRTINDAKAFTTINRMSKGTGSDSSISAYMFPSFLRTDLGTNLSPNLGIPQICPQIWGHIRPQIWGFPKFVPKF